MCQISAKANVSYEIQNHVGTFKSKSSVFVRGVTKNGGTRSGISWWHPFSYQKLVRTKKKRSSLQNKWVFGPKVCEDQKKKVFALKPVGF